MFPRAVGSGFWLGACRLRCLASREARVDGVAQASILEARDGGQVTVRSKLFDELRGAGCLAGGVWWAESGDQEL